jgi:hypothetical protein
MLRERRNGSRTRSQLMREELSESLDHAVRAAGHAASGMRSAGEQMAPVAGRVRDAASQRWGSTMAAFNDDPVSTARHAAKAKRRAKQSRREAEKAIRAKRRSRARAPRLAAMLAVGAALGAVWAVAQRRRRQQWDEYEPSPPMDTAEAARAVDEMAGGIPGGKPGDVVEKAVGGETEPAETGRTRRGQAPTSSGDTADDLMSRATGEEPRV